MITKNIGKNTIGDGKKMTVELKKYRRSTHDLSYAWRNTQCVGTLVPFMCEVGLPGDTWDINLQANVLTHPTVGPLFGSFKLQAEIYTCPVRLYNGKLHNNALGIGLNMSQIKFPKLQVTIKRGTSANQLIDQPSQTNEWSQINPSSILSYLGIKGYGQLKPDATSATVKKNATSILAYWDIFKNYHANKQEENAYFIGTGAEISSIENGQKWTAYNANMIGKPIITGDVLTINTNNTLNIAETFAGINQNEFKRIPIEDIANVTINNSNQTVLTIKNVDTEISLMQIVSNQISIENFPLKNIDEIREDILAKTTGEEYIISEKYSWAPLNKLCQRTSASSRLKTANPLFGLALKTYQSDIFNNWINTEWLDGAGGINEITAIDTSSGSFTMDTLNLAKRVYDMLNRVAVSGGTYQDWIQTVYTNEYIERSETPVYQGGYSDEVVFQEVISNSATEQEPLGTLAGRGKSQNNSKGGNITVKVEEPSYIIGLISLTPRVDYSQGNRWDTDLDNLDDLHKPALDGIGFQDLTTNKMAWWDEFVATDGTKTLNTVGKQPAWIDYMTNFNKVFGNFAIESNEMFMTLNRNYEWSTLAKPETATKIKDLTTYIDPQKYNYIFADTSLSAMNFWVQMGVGIKARRKMSAKIIPNL